MRPLGAERIAGYGAGVCDFGPLMEGQFECLIEGGEVCLGLLGGRLP